MILYLMRHGETDLNLQQRLQGQVDTELNETGLAQARTVGAALQGGGYRFDRVYSSHLKRALVTGALATGWPEDSITVDDRLLELDYGPYDAVHFSELGPEMFAFFRDPEHIDPPEGVEPIQALMARAGDFLQAMRELPPDCAVLAVTHGVAIRAFLALFTAFLSVFNSVRRSCARCLRRSFSCYGSEYGSDEAPHKSVTVGDQENQ